MDREKEYITDKHVKFKRYWQAHTIKLENFNNITLLEKYETATVANQSRFKNYSKWVTTYSITNISKFTTCFY